ncbi:MAG: hypothetical protein OEQ18_02390 [Gammaproteobacteria bacterium]|nr:hypothetical protein [Gammaproteobacteria bacterium]
MAHLDRLKISKRVISARRHRRGTETDDYRRNKLIANIEEQIELVQLALQDKPRELQRKRGHSIVTVRPRIWWKTEPDGKVFTEIRYNKVPLDIGGRGGSVEVGLLESLPEVYRTVIRAIKAGELDQSIRAAVLESRP